jgi:hypothetical protein
MGRYIKRAQRQERNGGRNNAVSYHDEKRIELVLWAAARTACVEMLMIGVKRASLIVTVL